MREVELISCFCLFVCLFLCGVFLSRGSCRLVEYDAVWLGGGGWLRVVFKRGCECVWVMSEHGSHPAKPRHTTVSSLYSTLCYVTPRHSYNHAALHHHMLIYPTLPIYLCHTTSHHHMLIQPTPPLYQCHAIPRYLPSTPRYLIPSHAMPFHTTLFYSTSHHSYTSAMPPHPIPFHTLLCYPIQHYAFFNLHNTTPLLLKPRPYVTRLTTHFQAMCVSGYFFEG